MKARFFLAIVTILLLKTHSVAQTRIGVFGGRNVASEDVAFLDSVSSGSLNFSNLTSAGYGAFLELGAESIISLRFEPMYLKKGQRRVFNHPNLGQIHSQIQLTYIELPVLIRVALTQRMISPYLLAGPSVGYLLKANSIYDDPMFSSFNRNIIDQNKRLDWLLRYGGGVNLQIGAIALFAQASYGHGLTKIHQSSVATYKTKGWYYGAGFSVTFGRKSFYQDQEIQDPPEDQGLFEVQDLSGAQDLSGVQDLSEIQETEIFNVIKECVPRLADVWWVSQLALVIYDGFQNSDKVSEVFLEGSRDVLVKSLVAYLEERNQYNLAKIVEWHECVWEVAKYVRTKIQEVQ